MPFNIGDAFGYPFKDPNAAQKLGIAMAVALAPSLALVIPLLGFLLWIPLQIASSILLVGYFLAIVRQALEGRQDLPDWSDLSPLAVGGLMLTLVNIVYNLVPGALVVSGAAMAIASLVGGLSTAGRDFDPSALMAAGAGVGGLMVVAGALLGLLLVFFSPAWTMRFAATDRFGAAFSGLPSVIGRSFGNYLLIAGLLYATMFVTGLLGGTVGALLGLVPFLGPFLAAAVTVPVGLYLGFAAAHMMGQYHRAFVE